MCFLYALFFLYLHHWCETTRCISNNRAKVYGLSIDIKTNRNVYYNNENAGKLIMFNYTISENE